MTDRALLTTLHQTQSAFERQRGIAAGDLRVLALPDAVIGYRQAE